MTAFQAGIAKAEQICVWNSGCASMGYELPAAIGAALARPGEAVTCIAGDGSIMMNLQELATIAFRRLPIRVLLLDNGGYASIRQTQERFFQRLVGCGTESGLGFPSWEKIADAFGLPFQRIGSPEALGAALPVVAARLAFEDASLVLDADALEVCQHIDGLALLREHPFEDLADRAPSNPQQRSHGAAVGLHGKPGNQVFECASKPGPRSSPGSASDHDAVLATLDARGFRFNHYLGKTKVGRPPRSNTLARIVPEATSPTARAPLPLVAYHANRHDESGCLPCLFPPHVLHHSALDTEGPQEHL